MNYLVEVLGDSDLPLNEQTNHKAIQNVLQLYQGQGKGSNLVSSDGTAWGLLNGVTEYVDTYRRAKNNDYRIDSAWWGIGAQIKEKAFEKTIMFLQ